MVAHRHVIAPGGELRVSALPLTHSICNRCYCVCGTGDAVDANHFRQRAASAREMAQFGEDRRLSDMLLEVACDLEAEAEIIEAEMVDASRRLAGLERP
jgi:hypothetical protein